MWSVLDFFCSVFLFQDLPLLWNQGVSMNFLIDLLAYSNVRTEPWSYIGCTEKKEMLCETPFCGSVLAPRAGLHPFLNDEGFWYIVVMSKCLAARSSIMGCIHFHI